MVTESAPNWSSLLAMLATAQPATRFAVQTRVAREISQLIDGKQLPKNVDTLQIALLRSATIEPLVGPLTAELAQRGFAARVNLSRLGSIAEDIYNDQSWLTAEPHDVCVVFALAEHVLPVSEDPSAPYPQTPVDEFIAQLEHLAQRFRGTIIVCNLAARGVEPAPRLGAQLAESRRFALERLNARLAELAQRFGSVAICDLQRVASELGWSQFWSPRDYATSMQPLSMSGMAALAAELAETIRLTRRTPVKCLVLDCDNTLWGGIVGEDGIDGLALGETYPGFCYQELQRQLLQLNRLGFLLVLCSKNNEADVRTVFEHHPGMLLKLDHVAAMRVNWQDKTSNILELAEELNLGVDSFVFIDDSDFEINLVRERLPSVYCVQTPPTAQAWKIPALLAGVPGLDRLRVTAEDRKKAAMYAQERQREAFKTATGSFEDYLRGLQINLSYERFNPEKHLARAAQLTQKTNQFNLTTRRYSEAELLEAAQSGALVRLASLSDRFGEYGRIALMIGLLGPDGVAKLDTFLMSCRVIGRGVEESLLRLLMSDLKAAGAKTLKAAFIPTARNAVSRDFLSRAGLSEIERTPDGTVHYQYELTGEIPTSAAWLTIQRQD